MSDFVKSVSGTWHVVAAPDPIIRSLNDGRDVIETVCHRMVIMKRMVGYMSLVYGSRSLCCDCRWPRW